MATVCEACGYKTNEVKSGGGIEPRGVRIEVEVKTPSDLSRDVLKSDTCHLEIPQIALEVGPGALGGRFTTVEGLLTATKEQLGDNMLGDSQDTYKKEQLETYLKQFDEIVAGKREITIILDDPAGNSYIQSLNDNDQPDEALRITQYERSFEQNEDLGLNDMRTENYES